MNQATAWSKNDRYLLVLLVLLALALIWSLIRPVDYFTWVLEVLPAVLGAVLLTALYRRFRFTNLVYTLIWLHALILIVGGHYTYAEMPLFNWIRIRSDWSAIIMIDLGILYKVLYLHSLSGKCCCVKRPWEAGAGSLSSRLVCVLRSALSTS